MQFPNLNIDNFIILDTETTGMTKNDEVIELALVDMQGNVLYESTYNPMVIINPWASAVHGMSNSDLDNSPCFADEWDTIKSIVGDKKLLGHNLSFDRRLVAQTLDRYGIDPAEAYSLFSGYYDSMYIAKKHIVAKSYALENLAHMVGISRPETHRAADDCIMTLEFLAELEKIASRT